MIARNYFSTHPVLRYAIEEIIVAYRADPMIDTHDFILIAVAPHYPLAQVTHFVQHHFSTDRFVAFHAMDAFSGMETISGIAMCVITFEREGSIKTLLIDDMIEHQDRAIKQTLAYLEANSDATHCFFSGHLEGEFSTFIDALEDAGADKTLFSRFIGGACSGTRDPLTKETFTYQATSDRVIKRGFALVSFCGCDSAMSAAFGYKPVGVAYTITGVSGKGNVAIDNNRSFIHTIDRLTRNIPNFEIRHLWYSPIVLLDEEDGSISVVRTFKAIHHDSVEFYTPLKMGARFKLSYAEPSNLLEADAQSAREVAYHLPQCDLAFNFSCIARQYALEDQQTQEAKLYSQLLNAPLFGFFTFGEIGPKRDGMGLKVYNQTSLLVGITER